MVWEKKILKLTTVLDYDANFNKKVSNMPLNLVKTSRSVVVVSYAAREGSDNLSRETGQSFHYLLETALNTRPFI